MFRFLIQNAFHSKIRNRKQFSNFKRKLNIFLFGFFFSSSIHSTLSLMKFHRKSTCNKIAYNSCNFKLLFCSWLFQFGHHSSTLNAQQCIILVFKCENSNPMLTHNWNFLFYFINWWFSPVSETKSTSLQNWINETEPYILIRYFGTHGCCVHVKNAP